jgi:hypothetical protein
MARSTPAMMGTATGPFVTGSSANCLNIAPNAGQVSNVCGVTVAFVLGLPFDFPFNVTAQNTGTITVKVPTLLANPFEATLCRAIGVGRNGSGFSGTLSLGPSVEGTFVDLPFSVNVPANGLMYVFCNLQPNGVITKVEHSTKFF